MAKPAEIKNKAKIFLLPEKLDGKLKIEEKANYF